MKRPQFYRQLPNWLWPAALIAAVLVPVVPSQAQSVDTPPSIVFFLVDDLGWADLSCYGSAFHESPAIDALAAQGVRFTDAYAASPVCSPTRAAIMTGRHPVRVEITDWLPGNAMALRQTLKFHHVHDRDQLDLGEVTIAELLKQRGYATFFAGKWHLGGQGYLPTDQGFDVNIGGNHHGSPPGGYYAPWTNPNLSAHGEGEYLTERLTEESLKFLQGCSTESPFLLFLSYYNVHSPITPYEKRVEHFRQKKSLFGPGSDEPIAEREALSQARQDNAAYASMVAAVDDSVGAVLGELARLGLDENTWVFFTSDNGGLCTLRKPGPTSNLPLRSGKGWLYEGGLRVPLIVRPPTRTSAVCNSLATSMDFLPTIAEIAGIEPPGDTKLDGKSLVRNCVSPDASQGADSRELYWHYPHYHGSLSTPASAIRSGDWKLIEFMEEERVELYDLANDIGEQDDLATDRPEKVAFLAQRLANWRRLTHARMPLLNPRFRRAEEAPVAPVASRQSQE